MSHIIAHLRQGVRGVDPSHHVMMTAEWLIIPFWKPSWCVSMFKIGPYISSFPLWCRGSEFSR